jgi:cell division protein FtsN
LQRNEDGEYELTLGNAQLLGIFAILVILLGIHFAMGYVVGRNAGAQTALARSPAGAKSASDNGPAPVKDSPAPETASSGSPAATPAPPQENTQPEQASPAKPAPATSNAKASEPDEGAILHVTQPESGETFLQVVATARADAETVAVALGKDNLHVRLSPAPNGLIRVLVGPTKDAADLARLRSVLESKGFHPIVRKF